MKGYKQFIISFFLFVSIFSCSPTEQKDTENKETIFLCNAEMLDDSKQYFQEANNQPQNFGNIRTRTQETAHSGNYSIVLTPEKQYGFTTDVEDIGPDQYIRVTAWRKSPSDNGVIVVDGGNGFYSTGKFIGETSADGWQKIYHEAYTPPNFKTGTVKIYVWNNSQDTVYFDDLEILVRDKKDYPEYESKESVNLHIDSEDIEKLQKKRITAFEKTILVNSDEDYVKLILFDGDDFLNGKGRLKGDWLDHIQGDKWSLRIKLKKDFAWKNMRTFSVQNPLTRNFVSEWLAHKIFKQEDVLTTRYGFVPLRLNDKSLGIYAWEEHFEKQLVESRQRREGPIMRLDESIFWQRTLENKNDNRVWDIDYFDAAPIIPFKESQIIADSLKIKQLVEGQKLMLQYKNQTQPVSKIFDIDKLAKYYALIDLAQAYHGFTWHNQRFYYNPVTCLLEPIAFDGYVENGIYKRFDQRVLGMVPPSKLEEYVKDELMLFHPFADSLFVQKYIECFRKYSSTEFISQLISSYGQEADSISNEIHKEFPYYSFDFGYIEDQAKWIRENLGNIEKNVINLGKEIVKIDFEKFRKQYTTDVNANLISLMVHAYYNRDKKEIEMLNFHNGEVKVLGAFMKDQMPESFDPSPVLQPFDGISPDSVSVSMEEIPVKILFSVNNSMYETEVYPWKYSTELTARQQTESKKTPNLIFKNGKVVLDGIYQFDTDVVIPENMQVIVMPGTKIDLVQNAGFFSFSPVKIEGTKAKPVEIFSSDRTANGFNVIQPKGHSSLKFVHFSGLGSIRKEGWQTPAAITLYEADVDIANCIFASNSNCDDALNIVRSNFDVQNCSFENTFADAFDSDFCTGIVSNCSFQNVGNDAIDFSGSQVEIKGCKMFDISDKAISGGEKSTLLVSDCSIEKANIGVASKDLSLVKLNKIEMETTVYGLVVFQKKPEYGPAKIEIDNLKMKDNVVFHQIEEGSSLTLNGKNIYGREKKLAARFYQ